MAGPYDGFLLELEQQLSRTARFVPVAFHVHSPESFDWARGSHAEAELNDRERLLTDPDGVREYLGALAAQFAIACITDHMKAAYACRLADEARKREDIVVFPGIELNCVGAQLGSSRIHVLAIFPPTATVEQIDRISTVHREGGFPAESDRSGQEELHLGSLRELAEAIHHEGGIFVLAHIDEHGRGQRARFRVMREESLGFERTAVGSDAPLEVVQQVSNEYGGYISELAPDAIEIMNPEARKHYVSFVVDGKPKRIPCVIRSDHHCVEDLGKEEAKTYVKVARPDFHSVREALKFFETRVRFSADLPAMPSPSLLGLRLQCPSKSGLFAEATIAFNPNLNCIIGSRGSGKSTIVEALRYVLGLNGTLLDIQTGDAQSQVNFADIARRTQEANLTDTLIELVFEREQQREILSATFDPETDVTTTAFDTEGIERKVASDALPSEYPVRLYSWSEIETLGREPDLQRALLDRLIHGLDADADRRRAIYASMAENRTQIGLHCQRLAELLRADSGLLRRYVQYKTDFERINTEEVAELFAGLDEAREREATLAKIEDDLNDLRSELVAVLEAADSLFTGPSRDDVSDEVFAWWEATVAPLLALDQTREETAALLRRAEALVAERLTAVAELKASEAQTVARTEAELRERTQASAEEEVRRGQREERKTRLDRAASRRADYEATFSELKDALEARAALAEQLVEVRDRLSELRASSRKELLQRVTDAHTGMDIDIELRSGADRRSAIHYMRDTDFLTGEGFGQYRAKEFAERCCRMARPTDIVRAILKRDETQLEHDGSFDAEGSLTSEEANHLVEYFFPFGHDDAADVDVIDARIARVLQLEEQPIDDRLRILMGGRPVDELSPGQRSSAMLPLVALSETAPLIIDQPEDNLDNRMVGETMTKILARLKEQRQIIVTTHNPNIVVGGDAEQVIVLDSPGAHEAVVERTGSIDDGEIIDAVVSIMEGGREAFITRERRYGLEG